MAREAYTFTTFPKNFIKKFFILQYYSKVLLSLPKNLETMALNTFWKVEDLEGHTEDSYWKSEGFFEKIGTNKKAFEERYRLNELRGREEDDPRTPLKGIIFNNRWRVSIIIVQGMKFKTCNCPEY